MYDGVWRCSTLDRWRLWGLLKPETAFLEVTKYWKRNDQCYFIYCTCVLCFFCCITCMIFCYKFRIFAEFWNFYLAKYGGRLIHGQWDILKLAIFWLKNRGSTYSQTRLIRRKIRVRTRTNKLEAWLDALCWLTIWYSKPLFLQGSTVNQSRLMLRGVLINNTSYLYFVQLHTFCKI